jgi:hypothetical protein
LQYFSHWLPSFSWNAPRSTAMSNTLPNSFYILTKECSNF